jgi:hypothetical protein
LVGTVHGFMKIDGRLDVTPEQNTIVARARAGSTVLNNKSMDNTATDARWDPSKVYSELLAADIGVRATAQGPWPGRTVAVRHSVDLEVTDCAVDVGVSVASLRPSRIVAELRI